MLFVNGLMIGYAPNRLPHVGGAANAVLEMTDRVAEKDTVRDGFCLVLTIFQPCYLVLILQPYIFHRLWYNLFLQTLYALSVYTVSKISPG